MPGEVWTSSRCDSIRCAWYSIYKLLIIHLPALLIFYVQKTLISGSLSQRCSLSMIAAEYSEVDDFPPRSLVIVLPCASVSKMAFSILVAWSDRPMCRSIMMLESKRAVGFARPFPAMSGAEPWTASIMATFSPILGTVSDEGGGKRIYLHWQTV